MWENCIIRGMEVTIKQLGNVQFEAAARGHRLLCDQPAENGGTDRGMTPPEFLLAALGACAAFYANQYLKLHAISCPGLEIKVTAEKAAQPARLGSFRIEVFAPAVDPRHESGMLRTVEKCLIHNTLLHSPTIETVVHTAALQGS